MDTMLLPKAKVCAVLLGNLASSEDPRALQIEKFGQELLTEKEKYETLFLAMLSGLFDKKYLITNLLFQFWAIQKRFRVTFSTFQAIS